MTKKSVAPYDLLAQIYDEVMAHVNYERWARYVHQILNRYARGTRTVVDISCGTGSCCAWLEEFGYRVFGADASLPMVKKAFEKAMLIDKKARFFCGDMRHLALRENVDAIISLYDSMNYLMTIDDWHTALKDIYTVLRPGGVFVFDVSTLRNSLRDFSNYRQKENVTGGAFLRKSSFHKKTGVQKNYFEIRLDEKPGQVFCETHEQVIRPLEEIFAILEKSPLEFVAGFKDFTFLPYTENSERVHFVLRKV